MADQITLTVDGGLYEGWIEAEIDRSLDRFAHSFRLDYTDRWTDKVEAWPIRAGAACQVKFGNHLLVTGWVDVVSFKADGARWSLNASGRSLTGDLADCSAIHATGHWTNANMKKIAEDLVAPYGLSVTREVPDTEVIRRFSIEEGETVHDALDRLVKNRGFLCHTSADGNVGMMQLQNFVGVVGVFPVQDAIEREYYEDDQDIFSQYLGRAQSFGESGDGSAVTVTRKFDGPQLTGIRHRPKVVVADSSSTLPQLQHRVQWEQNVRYGRSVRLRYTMPGVLDERGFPWTPGDQHSITDDLLGVDERLLLVSARIQSSDKKLETELEFTRPESFSLLEWPDEILNVVTKLGRPRVKKTKITDQQR